MRVIDGITGQRLSVDEAYDRFFDGFYNLAWNRNCKILRKIRKFSIYFEKFSLLNC